jgi:hypothetical protein
MKVIGHQAIGVHLPLRLAAGLAQRGKKLLVILIVCKDCLAVVTAIHDMVNRIGLRFTFSLPFPYRKSHCGR